MHVPRRKERMVGWCVQIGAPGEGLFSSLPPSFSWVRIPRTNYGRLHLATFFFVARTKLGADTVQTFLFFLLISALLHLQREDVSGKVGKGAEGDEEEEAN